MGKNETSSWVRRTSSTGLDCRIWSLTVSTLAFCPVTAAIYFIINFDVSVLPEPLSPLRGLQLVCGVQVTMYLMMIV